MSEQSYKLIGVESAYGLSIPQTPRKPETFFRWHQSGQHTFVPCSDFWVGMMFATYTVEEMEGFEFLAMD